MSNTVNRFRNPGLVVHALFAGAVPFLWYTACFWGIPFDFNNDLLYVQEATKRGLADHLARVFNPLTPAWFFLEDIARLRPLQFFLLQIVRELHGLTLPTIHLLACATIGILSAALFLLLERISKSKLFAWLGVLLYVSFPTHVFSMISAVSLDLQFLALFLTLCAVVLYWRVVSQTGDPDKSLYLGLAVVTILTWLTIKLHSSAKVLPCIFLTLCFIARPRPLHNILTRRFVVILAVVVGMFVLVVPFVQRPAPSDTERRCLSFSAEFALRRIFQSHPEGPFQLFTLKKMGPGSLTEGYGFFLGWVFWASLIVALGMRGVKRSGAGNRTGGAEDFFWPALVWFLSSLAGFACGQPPLDLNNRYLNYGLLPSVVLLMVCLFQTLPRAGIKMLQTKIIRGVLAACFVLAIVGNINSFSTLLKQWVGFQWASVQAEKVVFQDLYGREPADEEELYRAHPSLRGQRLWTQWEQPPEEMQKLIANNLSPGGALYYLARCDITGMSGFFQRKEVEADLLKQISLFAAPTPALRIARAYRTMRGRPDKVNDIFVYKFFIKQGPSPVSGRRPEHP